MTTRMQPEIVNKFGQVVGVQKARKLVEDAAETIGMSSEGLHTTDECIQLCLHIENEHSDITATIAHDVRDRLERQKHFQDLFSVLPDPAMIVTLEHNSVPVISANDTSESIFGFDLTPNDQQTIGDFVDPLYQDGFEVAIYRHLADRDQYRTQIAIRQGDRTRHFDARFSPIGTDELTDDRQMDSVGATTPLRGILVFTEITAQKQQKQDIQQLQQITEVLNRVLRHNLRNAMTTIIGRADHLRQHVQDDTAVGSTETIIRTGRKLTEISQNARIIQDFAEEMDNEEVDLVPMARASIESLERRHDEVRIRTDLPETAPAIADPHLEDVIENVLKNGVEHNDKATPVLDISIVTDRTAGETVLEIRDNGPGIPDHELEILDREFETPLEHGTGLGIWLVVWVVEQYGGTVSFHDRVPDGTTVEIRLDSPNR